MSGLWNPEFWSGLTGPVVAVIVCAAFVWALSTERLVLGKQYRAVVARADKYENAHHDVTQELMKQTAGQEATTAIVSALQREFAALASKGDQ